MVIKAGRPPAGVKHWMQVYEDRTPRFEIFVYLGTDASTGTYYFQSRKGGALIAKSLYQLNENGFRPFCIDFERMTSDAD